MKQQYSAGECGSVSGRDAVQPVMRPYYRTVNGVRFNRGIIQGSWFGLIFGQAVEFVPTGRAWTCYQRGSAGRLNVIGSNSTLKECLLDAQLHLLPDRPSARRGRDGERQPPFGAPHLTVEVRKSA